MWLRSKIGHNVREREICQHLLKWFSTHWYWSPTLSALLQTDSGHLEPWASKNFTYCFLKCAHLLSGSRASSVELTERDRFLWGSMWQRCECGILWLSDWDVGELWKRSLGVRRSSLCKPYLLREDMSGGCRSWGNHSHLFFFNPCLFCHCSSTMVINHRIDSGVLFWVIYSATLWVNL